MKSPCKKLIDPQEKCGTYGKDNDLKVLCQIEWVNLTLNVKKTKDVQSKGIVCEGTHGGEAMVYTRG